METRENQLLENIPSVLPSRIDGVVVGHVVAVDNDGEPFVEYPGSPDEAYRALSTVAIESGDVGRDVAICFVRGIPSRPVIIGFMWEPDLERESAPASESQKLRVESGEDYVVVEADKELTLRCGKSSITLTRAGKVLIRGKYISSRSAGVNRVKGGSVQIN